MEMPAPSPPSPGPGGRLVAILAAAAFCLVFAVSAQRDAIAGQRRAAVSPTAVQQAIDAAAGYLARATGMDGLFEYRVNTNPAVRVKPIYNILRHAGTVFAMTSYLAEQDSEALRRAARRAGAYLRDEALGPVPEAEGLLAVWSRPEVNRRKAPLTAKLGGTGLGLVALASLERLHDGLAALEDLQAMGRFLVYMQKEDGSFYSKLIASRGGRDDSWVSLYYPGEAALGLLMLHELDGDPEWLRAALEALSYLARLRRDRDEAPADSWALLATAKILSMATAGLSSDQRGLLIAHAVQICEAILAAQIKDPESSALKGGFSSDGRVTPAATRLEGLLAARTFLPRNTDLTRRIDEAVDLGMAFLLRAQISDGPFAGGFPRAIAALDTDDPAAESFNRRATEIRIDYVQHALGALIQYRSLLRERP
jgi:hypothetical protein